MQLCPLASGSRGNSIYFSTPQTRILVDAGLSARALARKLQEISVDIRTIDAILITHEHIDHIQGLKVLANQLNIPVFANAETAKAIIEVCPERPKFKIFSTGETFEFQDLAIHPFSIQHDTMDPVAFTIQTEGHKLGICTDLGFVTSLVEHHLQGCNRLVIESNHDPDMVMASARPQIYKQRVLGRSGHLSNESCGKLLAKIAHPELKHVYLAHLSSECNHPLRALHTVKSHLGEQNFDLTIAPQETIGQLLEW